MAESGGEVDAPGPSQLGRQDLPGTSPQAPEREARVVAHRLRTSRPMRGTTYVWVLLLALVAAACGPESAPEAETVNLSLKTENGVALNGTSFNSSPVRMVSTRVLTTGGDPIGAFPIGLPAFVDGGFNPFGGRSVDPFSGIGPNGASITGIQADELIGVELGEGITVEDVMDGEVRATTSRGIQTSLKITGVAAGTGDFADLLYYAVYAADGMVWEPLCGSAANGEPIPALAVPGIWGRGSDRSEWDYHSGEFTFACRGSSIAKCMEAGYRPWLNDYSRIGSPELRESEVSDAGHLQACVRMLRADYCGTGEAFTRNGRIVEFWDNIGINQRTMSNWIFEGYWTPNGLHCGESTRLRFEGKGPRCMGRTRKTNCLKRFEHLRGARIFSAYETQGVY